MADDAVEGGQGAGLGGADQIGEGGVGFAFLAMRSAQGVLVYFWTIFWPSMVTMSWA